MLDDYETRMFLIPSEFVQEHDLNEIVDDDGLAHQEIRGGTHGLPHDGMLFHIKLINHLSPFGYELVK